MARRALLVGINDYRSIKDLKGCLNDVGNMRDILKTYMGFTNNDIRILAESRASRKNILDRLQWMVKLAKPGDFMVFHFSGHGSQIRDREGDEIEDGMDELLCPWDHDWDGNFILDDDLDDIFRGLPENTLLEVFLDCCHSGDGISIRSGNLNVKHSDLSDEQKEVSRGASRVVNRYLEPPPDIRFRYEGDEEYLNSRGFTAGNRGGKRSTANHILWSSCRSDQEAADAEINGVYNGAFTYYFCKHFRETGGNLGRRELLERIRQSLRYEGYFQTPQLACGNKADFENKPLQMSLSGERNRLIFLTTPYMRGEDVRKVQQALMKAGFRITADSVFGPHSDRTLRVFQEKNQLVVDGVVGKTVRAALGLSPDG